MWVIPILIGILSIAFGWWSSKFVLDDPASRAQVTFVFTFLVFVVLRALLRRWQNRPVGTAEERARTEWLNRGLSAEAAQAMNANPEDAWRVLRGEAEAAEITPPQAASAPDPANTSRPAPR